MEVKVNDGNIEKEVLQSELPVLVDFWAPWCAPCMMVGPVIEEIAKEYAGKLKVCKVNVDDANRTAIKYRVMSIPTIAVFKGGEVVAQTVGALPRAEIEKLITPFI